MVIIRQDVVLKVEFVYMQFQSFCVVHHELNSLEGPICDKPLRQNVLDFAEMLL